MLKKIRPVFLAAIVVVSYAGRLFASDSLYQVTMEPVSLSAVSGDSNKFKQQNWLSRGYDGGFKDFVIKNDNIGNGISLESEGHALPANGDYQEETTLTKEDVAYLKLNYNQFRKYSDPTGGVFAGFAPNLRHFDTPNDLALDMGDFSAELGLTPKNKYAPALTFGYEHQFKEGRKSLANWTPVVVGSTTENIGPAWRQINETADTFSGQLNQNIFGFDVHGDERVELTRQKDTTVKRFLTPLLSADSSNNKTVNEIKEPKTNLFTSTWDIQKQLDKTTFWSTGYRYSLLKNYERENLIEYTQSGAPHYYSKNYMDATAHNNLDENTWVTSINKMLTSTLDVIARVRANLYNRHGDALGPSDKTAVLNGVPDIEDVMNTQEKGSDFGEGVSFRYSGIPRTALYLEAEFEQNRDGLDQDSTEIKLGPDSGTLSTAKMYTLGQIAYIDRGNLTLGGNFYPCDYVSITSQGRYSWSETTFDDISYHIVSTTDAGPVLMAYQKIKTAEATTRVVLRALDWLQPGFRYQLRNDIFSTRRANLTPDITTQLDVDGQTLSNIYTVDLMYQPWAALTLTGYYSIQNAYTYNQIVSESSMPIPQFNSDVFTWLFTADYSINDKMSLDSSLEFSKTDNYRDFTSIGLPLGADYEQATATVGLKWNAKKDMIVEPKYAFYHYNPNESVQTGGYNAHVVLLDVTIKFG